MVGCARFGKCTAASVLLSMLLAAATWCQAQDCIHYEDSLHWVTQIDVDADVLDAVASGNYLYLSGEYGFSGSLVVVDATVPTAPFVLSHVKIPGEAAFGVAVSGSHVYIAGGEGIRIVSIKDPSFPQLVGSSTTPGIAWDIVVSGSTAWLAVGTEGLVSIDVSDPRSPRVLARLDTPGEASALALSGHYLFVADGPVGGVQVVDISDPLSPRIVGAVDTPGHAQRIAVSGDYAFVADWEGGLQVIDVSDPSSPRIVGAVDTPGVAQDLAVSGNLAFVTDSSGFLSIDISDPQSPWIVGKVAPTGNAVVLVSGHAYVAGGGLSVFEISNPRPTSLLGGVDVPGNALDVAVAGSYAYVACSSRPSVQVIDVSDPRAPEPVGVCAQSGGRRLTIVGDYAYVAGSFGLEILDLSSPQSPRVTGRVGTPWPPWDVDVSGAYAYVADGNLRVVDVTDPSAPRIVASANVAAHAVAVSGNYAYAVDYPAGLQVIDISNPRSPALKGKLRGAYCNEAILVADDRAYLVGKAGFQIVDVSDPSAPSLLGTFNIYDMIGGVAVAGKYAYLSIWPHELRVVDVSDPGLPRIVGMTQVSGFSTGIALSGNCVYVADGRGLRVAPSQCEGPTPVVLQEFSLRQVGAAVEVSWRVDDTAEIGAFQLLAGVEGSEWEVPYRTAGRGCFTATDAAPRLVGGGTITYSLYGRTGGDPWLLGQQSLHLSVTLPRVRLLAPHPNPFNPRTEIPFLLGGTQSVTLAILAPDGRQVVELLRGVRGPGATSVVWAGTDDRGRTVPSGLYIARLQTGGTVVTRKLVLLR